ncbi:MAG: bifunctional phosphoglucose/phosphomannose isomerase [Patescibacteria group bacterium]
MFESIRKVKEQFLWEPELRGDRGQGLGARKIIVCGMGGSNVASGFLEMLRPDLEIVAHRSYGLPANAKKGDLIIISSYSGNTEEALDSFEKAVNGGFNAVAITTGGKLLELAKEKNISYFQIPETGIQPRMALGFSLLAMLKAVGDEENLKKAREFGEKFSPDKSEKEGIGLAEKLAGKIPVIYSSWNNKAIAYAWKVKLSETGKVPAFSNVFSELNHSEMIGFLAQGAAPEGVCGGAINPHFIFLKDSQDHSRIQKRMEITEAMFKEKRFAVDAFNLAGESFEKIFNSLALADWVSYNLAKNSGFDPEDSSIIEEFKEKIKPLSP